MARVLCSGTFDILHEGHLDYFRQARSQGDCLIVVVAHDENVRKEKREPLHTQEERMRAIIESGAADIVVAGDNHDKLAVVERFKPDVIVLGYDQNIDEENLQKLLAKRGLHPRIVRAHAFRPELYKSSILSQAK